MLLKALDIPKARAAELQNVPFEAIMDAQLSFRGKPGEFKPVVDGHYLPHDPFDPAAPEISADIPVMITTMFEDGAMRRGPFNIDEDQLNATAVSELGAADAPRVLAAYRAAWPNATPIQIQSRLLTDRNHRWRAHIQGERRSAQKRAATYMYRFDFPSPAFGGKFGAVHGTDVELGFHNWRQLISGNNADARKMADRLAPTLVAFARTGNPNNPAIPNWPAYTSDQRAMMIFDLDTRAENDPQRELRELANSVQGSRRPREL
jgi:para-nitrobenzyl esterase